MRLGLFSEISEAETAPRDRVAVLIDRSGSMALADQIESRWNQAIDLLRTDLLPVLQDAGWKVEAVLFAEQVLTRTVAES